MTIGSEFVELIEAFAEMGEGPPMQILRDNEDGRGCVEISLLERTTLAVSCVVLSTLPPSAPRDWKAHAAELAQRLTYLQEPLRVFEQDSISRQSLLRSQPPKATPSGTSYFELVVKQDGEATLCRYQQEPDRSREKAPFTLTLETLARVVDDLLET